jgi:diacylglycerol kinase (ATP)
MRLLVVHNAKAGHDGDRRDVLVAALERAGHSTFCACKGQAEIHAALELRPDAVVVLGGDGSVTAVARELVGSPIPIVPVPLGTANNVARFLDAGDDPLPALARGRTLAIDVGVCEIGGMERVFLEGAGWGPFPEVVALLAGLDADAMVEGREDELDRDGRLLREVAARAPARICRIELDGREISSRLLLAEVLNIRSIGPNLLLAPDADPVDELLDLTLVDEVERPELLTYLAARLSDRSLPPPFTVHRARHIRMVLEDVTETALFHIDDEVVDLRGGQEVTFSVRPSAVRFLV